MTRINVVPPEELSNAHLEVEHYELHRLYVLVRKAIARGEEPDVTAVPTYRMGTGHVRFFYPRLGFIKKRETKLIIEMLYRGLPLVRQEEVVTDIPSSWFYDYEPTEEAINVNRERLALRTMEYERNMLKGYFK